MITYSELYEALRKERYNDALQVLSKSFVNDVAEYFRDKKNFSEKDEELFSDLASKNKKKLENAIAIFKELVLRRRKKILNLAFVASETGISKKDFENMLDFERELFEEIVKSLEKGEKGLNEMMVGKKIIEKKNILVRFLEGVPAFLNLDGQEIGPFEKGEVANIDKEIAGILLSDKKVDVIDED
jgi:DNA replication initiation complex subunit (GINS family)